MAHRNRVCLALAGAAALSVSVAGVGQAFAAGPALPGLPSVPALPAGPNPPQLDQLPGADKVPNLSTVPGAPGVPGLTLGDQGSVTNPAVGGRFSAPFAEPGPSCPNETEGSADAAKQGADAKATDQKIACKPAGVSVVLLPQSNAQAKGPLNLLYWDGLEGEENVQYNIVAEFGDKAGNDMSRRLSLDPRTLKATWTRPRPSDGGADGAPDSQYLVPDAPGPLASVLNDQGPGSGALFCSDQVILSNGQVIVPGGTDYYAEPKIPGTPYGVAELQGLRNTRVYNPGTSSWYESGEMNLGRWYPSLTTLADGKVLVTSGVTKLIKPVYPNNPLMSGTNVKQTETFDPKTGRWTQNPASADRSLPLYPRNHLLPDGHVFYDTGGQTFNPAGQSYDEALWNMAASYDPKTQSWTDLGVPVGVSTNGAKPLNTSLTAGFRGSSFSVMMPLRPDAKGAYNQAQILSAGGVLGTSPGAYLADASSQLSTVTTTGGHDQLISTATGALQNARWFSTGLLLPTGEVLAFNGANRDDVVLPSASFPVTQTEMFDPKTQTWHALAASGDPRTYHNTAVLLPSGQVLVGGHSPISTGYAYNTTVPGGFIKAFRDPSFQVYNPPYLEWGIPQPVINDVRGTKVVQLPSGRFDNVGYGSTLTISTPQAASTDSVTLVRNTALTHLVDADQRSVVLPVVSRTARTVTVKAPPTGAVAPPGAYMLFVNQKTAKGLIPSVAKQVFVGASQTSIVPPAPASPGATAATYAAARNHLTDEGGFVAPGATMPRSAVAASSPVAPARVSAANAASLSTEARGWEAGAALLLLVTGAVTTSRLRRRRRASTG